jgi:hypothetical protein
MAYIEWITKRSKKVDITEMPNIKTWQDHGEHWGTILIKAKQEKNGFINTIKRFLKLKGGEK